MKGELKGVNMKKMYWVKKLSSLLLILVLVVGVIYPYIPIQAAETTEDTDVKNTASFSTDVIYQIVTDRFFDGDVKNNPTGEIFDKSSPYKYHGGDWSGITKKIKDGYFTNMGITALWISSPVENISSIDPMNQSAAYHGYWAKDYFRTNPYFGSVNDFKTLIDTAHHKGIKIVIDFTPNHTSTAEKGSIVFPEDGALYKDGVYLGGYKSDYLGLFNHESWTDFRTYENSIYHSLYGLADLNQQNEVIDTYLKDSIRKWLALGVDGIRVDAVKHMSLGWQKNWLSSIYSFKPVFVFGEWFYNGTTVDSDMKTFANDSGMSLLDFSFSNALRNALGNKSGTMRDLNTTVTITSYNYEEVNDQVTFIDNHDMSRFMTLANNNQRAVENAYVILLTSRGIPTIYYGSEQYAKGEKDPYNRGNMPSFDTNSTAYKVIARLAPLRKTNPALTYGTTKERWVNDDVYIYERQFGDNVVITAVNRNQDIGYTIAGLNTNLPKGIYTDVMAGILGGGKITVSANGAADTFVLGAGQSAVWQYNASNYDKPMIGNVDPLMGITGNSVTITGRGFGKIQGKVKFNSENASIVSWSDTLIKIIVPDVTAGKYDITVANNTGVESDPYEGFEVLTGQQVSVRFMVSNANTYLGTNVYVVGNIYELGNWDSSKAIGPFFNNTQSIGKYPTWFYDINIPAGRAIEYKYIKKDNRGNVIWESGNNHSVVSPAKTTGTFYTKWQSY